MAVIPARAATRLTSLTLMIAAATVVLGVVLLGG
jgi:hypothetical protein